MTPATRHPPTPDPVLLSDARIARMPVVERGEDLVRVVAYGGLSVGEAIPVPPADGVAPPAARVHDLLRREVARRLALAAATLPDHERLHLVEGYRPPEVQAALYEAHRRRLLADLPGIDVAESHVLASRFVAPPSVAAHPSGAAVDVTLVEAGGRPLDMGTAIDATPEDSDGACYLDASGISALARDNRRLLAASLRTAGFVNYPTEWWHWSYGDRYWAFVTRAAAASYGELSRPLSFRVSASRSRGRGTSVGLPVYERCIPQPQVLNGSSSLGHAHGPPHHGCQLRTADRCQPLGDKRAARGSRWLWLLAGPAYHARRGRWCRSA